VRPCFAFVVVVLSIGSPIARAKAGPAGAPVLHSIDRNAEEPVVTGVPEIAHRLTQRINTALAPGVETYQSFVIRTIYS